MFGSKEILFICEEKMRKKKTQHTTFNIFSVRCVLRFIFAVRLYYICMCSISDSNIFLLLLLLQLHRNDSDDRMKSARKRKLACLRFNCVENWSLSADAYLIVIIFASREKHWFYTRKRRTAEKKKNRVESEHIYEWIVVEYGCIWQMANVENVAERCWDSHFVVKRTVDIFVANV